MIHYASFTYDWENYLAVGETEDYLAVYVESGSRRYVRHGRTRWPSWHKFMQGGEFADHDEGSVSHIRELEQRYGSISSRGREDILDDQRAQPHDNLFRPPNAPPEALAWYEKRDQAVRIWRETGDDSLLIELGLFPSRRAISSEGEELE